MIYVALVVGSLISACIYALNPDDDPVYRLLASIVLVATILLALWHGEEW